MSDAIGPKPPGEVEMKSIESPIAPTAPIDRTGRIIHIDRLVRAQRLEVADYAESRSPLSAERQNLRSLRDELGGMRVSSSSTRWKSAAIAVDDASQTVFKEISKISPK